MILKKHQKLIMILKKILDIYKNSEGINDLNGIQIHLIENEYDETENDINEILLCSIIKNENHKSKLILEYAYKNDIILKINGKNKYGNNPFIWSINNNNIEIAKLIIDYAEKKNIIININEKTRKGNYPLLISIKNNDIDMVKLIVEYAYKNDVSLIIKKNDIKEASKINVHIKDVLINYINTINKNFQNILIENGYSETEDDINKFFMSCVNCGNIRLVKLIIAYANKNNMILKINEVVNNNNSPLLWCIINSNLGMAELIINYANSNRIILKINEIDIDENYPFLLCIIKNNIDMAQLIINYSIENNIKLNINEKNKFNYNPLLCSINSNNIELVKLIIDYANKTNIKLNIEENDIKEASEINKDIEEILESYKCSKNENGESSFQINNNNSNNYNNKNDNIRENYNSNEEKGKSNLNINNENSQFVIAEYDFISRKEDELNFKKGDKIRIINWNFKEGWAYGCKSNDLSKMGVFPQPLVTFENSNNKSLYKIIIIF